MSHDALLVNLGSSHVHFRICARLFSVRDRSFRAGDNNKTNAPLWCCFVRLGQCFGRRLMTSEVTDPVLLSC
jgi:hypothetical protein